MSGSDPATGLPFPLPASPATPGIRLPAYFEVKAAGEMLDLLDRFFASASEAEQRRLWNILTALRGPDRPDLGGAVKDATTARIRTLAFPQTARQPRPRPSGAIFAPAGCSPPDVACSDHFTSHIADAVVALRELGRICGLYAS